MKAILHYHQSDTMVGSDIFSQMQKTIHSLSEYEREEFEERSAIMEFAGGLSREEAEWQALLMTIEKRMKLAV
jgi:hypothetical protein